MVKFYLEGWAIGQWGCGVLCDFVDSGFFDSFYYQEKGGGGMQSNGEGQANRKQAIATSVARTSVASDASDRKKKRRSGRSYCCRRKREAEAQKPNWRSQLKEANSSREAAG